MTEYLSLYHGLIEVTPKPTMKEIALLVADRYGLTLEELKGPSRLRKIAYARHEAMTLIHREGRYSLSQNGRFFNRDHTTVIWAIRAHEARARGVRLARKCHEAARAA